MILYENHKINHKWTKNIGLVAVVRNSTGIQWKHRSYMICMVLAAMLMFSVQTHQFTLKMYDLDIKGWDSRQQS